MWAIRWSCIFGVHSVGGGACYLLVVLIVLYTYQDATCCGVASECRMVSSAGRRRFIHFQPCISRSSVAVGFEICRMSSRLGMLLSSIVGLAGRFCVRGAKECIRGGFSFLMRGVDKSDTSVMVRGIPINDRRFGCKQRGGVFFCGKTYFFYSNLCTGHLFGGAEGCFAFHYISPQEFFTGSLTARPCYV